MRIGDWTVEDNGALTCHKCNMTISGHRTDGKHFCKAGSCWADIDILVPPLVCELIHIMESLDGKDRGYLPGRRDEG